MRSRLGAGDGQLHRGRQALRRLGRGLPAAARQPQGRVEKANHGAAQRWWRTLADEHTPESAQADVDRYAVVRGDARERTIEGRRVTVAELAASELLNAPPAAPYPAMITTERTASRQALVSYRGNRYSVPPELAAAAVLVSHPVGGQHVDIATAGGIVIARHRLAADGLGVTIRDSGHVLALDTAAMTAANTGRPHRRKERIPPGAAAKAAAAALRATSAPEQSAQLPTFTTDSTVIDMSVYERAAQKRTLK